MSIQPFDLGRYLEHSKMLEVDDLPWDQVREHPLSGQAIRALSDDFDNASNPRIDLSRAYLSRARLALPARLEVHGLKGHGSRC